MTCMKKRISLLSSMTRRRGVLHCRELCLPEAIAINGLFMRSFISTFRDEYRGYWKEALKEAI